MDGDSRRPAHLAARAEAPGNPPASARVTNDRCDHYGVCGGCQLQHIAYPGQLAAKQRTLADLLAASLGSAPPISPVIGTPHEGATPWRFRQKAAFVFGTVRGRLAIGHFAAGGRTVVPVHECPVHSDRANRLAFALARGLDRAGLPAAGPRLDGIVRHVLVRTTRDDREAVAMLVVTRNDRALRAPLRAFLEGPERPTGFYLNVHDRQGPFMVGRETIKLAGRSHVRENLLGTSFLISPTAFFQTNVEAAGMLLAHVLDTIGAPQDDRTEGGRVLDLYSGSGLFALPLAARGWQVTAVEENRDATRDAAANLRLNRLPDRSVHVITARVDDALPRLAKTRFGVVILDPPREGCPRRVLDAVFSGLAPSRSVYVSCNPLSLAAELPHIIDAGYRIESVQPIDMFAHTEHVETVVTLRKDDGGGKRRERDKRGRRDEERKQPGSFRSGDQMESSR